jgi:hypothetical protein
MPLPTHHRQVILAAYSIGVPCAEQSISYHSILVVSRLTDIAAYLEMAAVAIFGLAR